MLDLALVPLGVPVIVNADEDDVSRIVGNGMRIVAGLDLADGCLGVLVVF